MNVLQRGKSLTQDLPAPLARRVRTLTMHGKQNEVGGTAGLLRILTISMVGWTLVTSSLILGTVVHYQNRVVSDTRDRYLLQGAAPRLVGNVQATLLEDPFIILSWKLM